MRKFLAIYTCAENSKNHQAWNRLDSLVQDELKQKGLVARQQWAAKYKNQIVFEGGPLGKTKKVDPEGIHDIPSQMGAFVVIEASSHEEAAKIFLEHPHFTFFPGDAVEIIEWVDHSRA